MLRSIEVTGEQIEVHADIGPGRILRAILLVDDEVSIPSTVAENIDPFGAELDLLLAETEVVPYFVDDSREAAWAGDDDYYPKSTG